MASSGINTWLSKDSAAITFIEGLPAIGFVAALGQSLAGNKDQAWRAVAMTTRSTATVLGGLAGLRFGPGGVGPNGAVHGGALLGAALGSVIGDVAQAMIARKTIADAKTKADLGELTATGVLVSALLSAGAAGASSGAVMKKVSGNVTEALGEPITVTPAAMMSGGVGGRGDPFGGIPDPLIQAAAQFTAKLIKDALNKDKDKDPPIRLVTAKQDQKARALDVELQKLATFSGFNNDLKTWLQSQGKQVGGIDDLTGSFRNGLVMIVQGQPWALAYQVYVLARKFYDDYGPERLDYLKGKYEVAQHVVGGSVTHVVDFTVAVTKVQSARIELDLAMGKDE